MCDGELVYYLYCLTPRARYLHVSAIGVDALHPIIVRGCGKIGAVLSEVERREFCGQAAEARLEDLEWLGPRVCRHEAAIEEVMRQTPVLPARFATLFTSIDALKQAVLERLDAIGGFFAQLGDKQEWAVKGLLNRNGALKPPGSSDRFAAEARTGTRYFEEKRIQAHWERDLTFRLKEFRRRAATALSAHAEGFRERKVLASVTAGTGVETVLNWAFLLPPNGLDEFRGRLESLNEGEALPGLKLTLSGPWPPHSFVPDLSLVEKV